ncbi:hypothetical protein NQ314_006823 [Rhamnusium bicolor]|uniref:Uncharacterized protein n=1 Tax=Rhamnusium bicolor TaxID=1586634 RepID=A0AAV8YW78_9CUCU|nr:hypothetical protein NQ314_006823 [Rhamnusium bicolor]
MPHDEYRYNSCIFGVPKKKGILIQQIDSGNKPAFRENIMVYNIGRTEVYVEIKHGTNAKWEGTISAATIKPREKLVVKFGETLYYVTAVKVWNTSNVRAVVHCRHTENRNNCWVIKEPGTFDENKNIFLKHVFPLGVKYLPYLGAGLSGIISVFWPHSEPNLWEQIYDKVMKLVNRKVLDAINVILDCDIKKCYEWMKKIEIEDSEDLSFDYMILAEYLVGLEKKVYFRE